MVFNILGRTRHRRFIFILILSSLILLLCRIYKYFNCDNKEGFYQKEQFVLLEGDNIFDDFYASAYKIIHKPHLYVDSISDKIIDHTRVSDKNSVLLVITIDTGEQYTSFSSKGVNVCNVIKYIAMDPLPNPSLLMNNKFRGKYVKDVNRKVDDIEKPIIYENSTFSHVFCSGSTLYTIKNKSNLFRNIYNWLKPDGIILLQLYDRSKFDTILSSKTSISIDSPQQYVDERITDSDIDFGAFKYLSRYDFKDAESKDLVYFSETFTNKSTHNVRKHEQTLYMENIDNIIDMVKSCGFSLLSKIELIHDNNQFVYVLERKH